MEFKDTDLMSNKAMRIAYCYHCNSLSRVQPFEGPPEYDVHLQRWIDEHLHGMSVDQHPGGRIFVKEASEFDHSGEAGEAFEEQAVEEVRAELAKANQEVYAYRDAVKEDAVKCHRKHGQPHWPTKPCQSYRSDDKRIGRTNVPKDYQQYVCTYCPYNETVRVDMRHKAGWYKK